MDLRKDVRVLRSEPTDKSWECRVGCAFHEEIELYPLYNWEGAKLALDTKTYLCSSIPTPTTKHTGELPQSSTLSGHMPKPASHRMDPTPIPLDVQAHPFRHH